MILKGGAKDRSHGLSSLVERSLVVIGLIEPAFRQLKPLMWVINLQD